MLPQDPPFEKPPSPKSYRKAEMACGSGLALINACTHKVVPLGFGILLGDLIGLHWLTQRAMLRPYWGNLSGVRPTLERLILGVGFIEGANFVTNDGKPKENDMEANFSAGACIRNSKERLPTLWLYFP